jgi:hypothetical protein
MGLLPALPALAGPAAAAQFTAQLSLESCFPCLSTARHSSHNCVVLFTGAATETALHHPQASGPFCSPPCRSRCRSPSDTPCQATSTWCIHPCETTSRVAQRHGMPFLTSADVHSCCRSPRKYGGQKAAATPGKTLAWVLEVAGALGSSAGAGHGFRPLPTGRCYCFCGPTTPRFCPSRLALPLQ